MIETAEGLENLHDILVVEELEGIYVGPNDLCLALGVEPSSESDVPIVKDAIARIVDACRSAGKAAGILSSSGQIAEMRIEQGSVSSRQVMTPCFLEKSCERKWPTFAI